MSDFLRPCPHCGKQASADGKTTYMNKEPNAWWADGTPVEVAYHCSCMSCGANNHGLVGGFQTRERAIEEWNKRIPEDTALRERDEARAMAETEVAARIEAERAHGVMSLKLQEARAMVAELGAMLGNVHSLLIDDSNRDSWWDSTISEIDKALVKAKALS